MPNIPTVGRVLWFVSPSLRTRPALCMFGTEDGRASLHVFFDPVADGRHAVEFVPLAPYDESGTKAGTWRWPEFTEAGTFGEEEPAPPPPGEDASEEGDEDDPAAAAKQGDGERGVSPPAENTSAPADGVASPSTTDEANAGAPGGSARPGEGQRPASAPAETESRPAKKSNPAKKSPTPA